jgi:hypothetical protein
VQFRTIISRYTLIPGMWFSKTVTLDAKNPLQLP